MMETRRFARFSLLIGSLLTTALHATQAVSECPDNANRALIEKLFYQGFSGGVISVLEEVFDENIEFHDPAFPPGIEGIKQLVAKNNQSFENWHFTIHEMLCDGSDRVVVRWNGNGIHVRSWMGEPPTGNTVDLNGISIYQIEGNKVTADWVVPDNLGFLMQIGVLAPMDLTKEK